MIRGIIQPIHKKGHFDKSRREIAPLLTCLTALTLVASGCIDEDKACGDMELVDGMCIPKTQGTDTNDPPDTSDAGADAGADENADTEEDGLPAGMGDVCTGDGTCTGEADFCALEPGAAEGMCTVQGCTVEPNDCPAGYICFDLSIFAAGLPTICQAE
jgi:hypothetical protein